MWVLIGTRSVLVKEAERETNKNKLETTVQNKNSQNINSEQTIGIHTLHLEKIQMKEQISHSRASVHTGKSISQLCNTARKQPFIKNLRFPQSFCLYSCFPKLFYPTQVLVTCLLYLQHPLTDFSAINFSVFLYQHKLITK